MLSRSTIPYRYRALISGSLRAAMFYSRLSSTNWTKPIYCSTHNRGLPRLISFFVFVVVAEKRWLRGGGFNKQGEWFERRWRMDLLKSETYLIHIYNFFVIGDVSCQFLGEFIPCLHQLGSSENRRDAWSLGPTPLNLISFVNCIKAGFRKVNFEVLFYEGQPSFQT